MHKQPEIITDADSGVKMRFTPLPLKGFNGEYGLFVPVRLYTRKGMIMWQYEEMMHPEGCQSSVRYIGAGILRDMQKSGNGPDLSFLSILSFVEKPNCNISGEDIVVEGGGNGLRQSGTMPLLSDMPSLKEHISKRYNGVIPISIAKLIPTPESSFVKKMFAPRTSIEVSR